MGENSCNRMTWDTHSKGRVIWITGLSGAGKSGDDAIRIHLANHVILRVGDVDGPVIGHGHVTRGVELRLHCWAAVAAVAP